MRDGGEGSDTEENVTRDKQTIQKKEIIGLHTRKKGKMGLQKRKRLKDRIQRKGGNRTETSTEKRTK